MTKQWKPKLEWRDPQALIPYSKNAKVHSKAQINKLAGLINEFGFTQPIVVDEAGVIIAGHCRREAAIALLMKEVPVVVASHLDEYQVMAARIADNRVSEAPWDTDMLKFDLGTLNLHDFDMKLTGFDVPQIEDFLKDGEIAPDFFGGESVSKQENEPPPSPVKTIEPEADESPVVVSDEPKSKRGDVWILGSHRLMCGDATDMLDVDQLKGVATIDMVFTDPPYGIKVVELGSFADGKQYNGMAAKHGKYKPVMNDETTAVAHQAYEICKAFEIPTLIFWGANFYPKALDEGFSWLVWDKETTAPSFSDCEIAFVNKKGKLHIFKHQWTGMIKASERGEKRVHPTQKPVALAEWCFENYGKPKTVLDLFGGSGSTLIACEKTGRQCFMMELDPHYIDVILTRWGNYTGQDPFRESDNVRWSELHPLVSKKQLTM